MWGYDIHWDTGFTLTPQVQVSAVSGFIEKVSLCMTINSHTIPFSFTDVISMYASSYAFICWLLSGFEPDNSQQMDVYELAYVC